MLVNSTAGTVYQGLIPKKLRETIVATTEAKTKGANRFMEKLPSTTSEANTAPAMGALYADAMPEAAPQPTNNRSRYGCHLKSWPHFEASVAAICVIAPSRPMDAPVPMLISEETAFTMAVRKGKRPSPATITSSRLLEPCCPTRRKPQ